MRTGRELHSPQQVVGSEIGSFDAVDIGCPAVLVVDLREDRRTGRSSRVFVPEIIGPVLLQTDFPFAADQGADLELSGVDDGRRFGVDAPQGVDLLFGSGGIDDLLHEPGRPLAVVRNSATVCPAGSKRMR